MRLCNEHLRLWYRRLTAEFTRRRVAPTAFVREMRRHKTKDRRRDSTDSRAIHRQVYLANPTLWIEPQSSRRVQRLVGRLLVV